MDGYGKRALIIGDDEDILYVTGIVLMNRGYNVYASSDGFGGSEQMKKRRYDVVLVDYHMPEFSGLRFIEICRTMWPETPIILMSGDDYVIDHSNLIKGIFGCIAKPFEPSVLIELVNRACRQLSQGDPLSCDGRTTDPRSSPLKGRDTSLQAARTLQLNS